ncbi:MAG: hypothetical protein SV760_06945, partial [Halobacteria archaeon]|nr:hypothetical protein [Halobacteria archaeon]
VVSSVGASLWFAGVGVFVITLAHTLRGNPTGSRTGTSETKSERWFVDRYSNAFVPVVLGYLVVGGYAVVASSVTPLPTPFDGYPPRATHLLAAGVATLLVLAVGYRLLPRFLATHPPKPLVVVSLPGAAVGPVLISSGLTDGSLLLTGALAESVGVVGFSASYLYMYVETERSRVGVHSVALASVFGVLGVALGAWFSVVGTEPRLVES